jgi:hypothetical protein
MFDNYATAALAHRPRHLDIQNMTYRSHEHRTRPPFYAVVMQPLQFHDSKLVIYLRCVGEDLPSKLRTHIQKTCYRSTLAYEVLFAPLEKTRTYGSNGAVSSGKGREVKRVVSGAQILSPGENKPHTQHPQFGLHARGPSDIWAGRRGRTQKRRRPARHLQQENCADLGS